MGVTHAKFSLKKVCLATVTTGAAVTLGPLIMKPPELGTVLCVCSHCLTPSSVTPLADIPPAYF